MSELDPAQLRPIGSLDDDTRRRLYELVVAADQPVSRDTASRELEIDRSLAAYHLDRMANEGLLDVSFARPEGRGGPGAGRPAKHYERSSTEIAVSLPPRDYRLAAEILARAVEEDTSGQLRRAVETAAARIGAEDVAGSSTDDLVEVLRDQGFEPYHDEGVVRLRNCPFHRLAQDHTDLVCGMNLAMLTGVLEELDASASAHLDPAPGRCCVAFVVTD